MRESKLKKTPWEGVRQHAVDSLRALIRLDTRNPPGDERIAAEFIAEGLAGDGVHHVIKEGAPTRASLIARIPGKPGGEAPLMLSSHTDVVPVEPDGWSRAPFSADLADGCVWGRGSIDMKSKTAMDLALTTSIARAGVTPNRDLIMAAVADEEAGSDLGAKFLVERHPELVRAGFVLNEVGGFTVHFGNRRFYPIQVAEKGFVTLKMKVKAMPSHGSIPRADTAIAKISELITKIVNTPLQRRMSPLMRKALERMGVPIGSEGELFQPMLANTVSPTILRAGYKDNVIPGEATVVLDGRTLPGQNPESLMAELRAIVGPEPSFELVKAAPPVESSTDTPLFDLICRRVEAADPGAETLAWMIPGATDSKFYARLGATCYGFSPVKLDPEMPFGSLYHGHNERMPVNGFLWGLRVYADVVLDFLGLRFDQVFA